MERHWPCGETHWLSCTVREEGEGDEGERDEEEEEEEGGKMMHTGSNVSKRCDITSSHLITILTACRDDLLAMNSKARDS